MSGDLELLEDDVLKSGLIDFFGAFEDVRVSEAFLRQLQVGFLQSEAFEELVGMHRMFGYPDRVPGSDLSTDLATYRRWSESEELLNGIATLTGATLPTLEDYDYLSTRIERIRERLAAARTESK